MTVEQQLKEPTAATSDQERTLAEMEGAKVRELEARLVALERERRTLSAILDFNDSGFLVFDSSLKVLRANRFYLERLAPLAGGGEIIGSPCNRVLCRREKICDRCPALRPFTSGLVAHHEFLADVGGQSRHIYATGMPITSSEGDIEEAIVMLQDLSNLKVLRMSQQALKSSEDRFRSIFEKAAVGMATFAPDGRFLQVNPALCRFLGYSESELNRRTVFDVTHHDYLPECRRLFGEVEAGRRRVVELERRFVRKDGSTAWGYVTEAWLFDPALNPTYSIALIQDVTERRVSEQARQRLATAVEQAGESIMITDTEGIIEYVNPAFERVTGFSRAEIVGRAPALLSGAESAHRDIWIKIRRGEVWSGRLTSTRKDGTPYQEEVTVSPVRDASGRIVNYVTASRDVTQEIALQAQLYQSQKMEAIGTLAGGVAHDFNNILTGIMGHAELLKLESGLNAKALSAAETIERASHRAAELTRKLLGFARRGKHQNVPVDLQATIQEVIGLLGPTLDKKIEISCEFSEEQVLVMGDPGQLQQVVLNLAVNARDAMSGGGVLSFSSHVVEVGADEARSLGTPGLGRYLRLAVSDTGTGIPDDVRGRIFEPFFTTKERGKGTGMGLAMVYGIVRNHGGVIKVDTEVGSGTTFSVYIPTAQDVTLGEPERPPERVISGAGRILVADDEEIVRDVAVGYLAHLGYETVAVADGQAAVDYYRDHHREIDLVLIDMVMPKLGGRDCYRALKGIDPSVCAVLSTGYGFNVAAQEILDEGVAGFVQKPYEMRQLSEVVAEALRRQPKGPGG